MTVSTVLAGGPAVVEAFGAVLILVVALGFGMYAVKRIPSWIKRATR
jgi:hypothetical protein